MSFMMEKHTWWLQLDEREWEWEKHQAWGSKEPSQSQGCHTDCVTLRDNVEHLKTFVSASVQWDDAPCFRGHMESEIKYNVRQISVSHQYQNKC